MSSNPFESPITSDAEMLSPSGRKALTLRYIHPLQAGKVLGILYMLLALIFVPFIVLAAAFGPDAQSAAAAIGMGVGMFLMYAIIGFIGGIIGAVIYNLVASSVGGLRFDFE